MRTVQPNHNISLVAHHTLLAALEQALLLHQFQCEEGPVAFKSREKDSRKPARSYTLYDIEIGQLDPSTRSNCLPNGFNFQKLSLENFDGPVGLKIIILEDIPSSHAFPVDNMISVEVLIACIRASLPRTSFSKRMMWGRTVSLRFLSSQVVMGMEIRLPLYTTFIRISGGFSSSIFFFVSCWVDFFFRWDTCGFRFSALFLRFDYLGAGLGAFFSLETDLLPCLGSDLGPELFLLLSMCA